jgi:hypothetical protein
MSLAVSLQTIALAVVGTTIYLALLLVIISLCAAAKRGDRIARQAFHDSALRDAALRNDRERL